MRSSAWRFISPSADCAPRWLHVVAGYGPTPVPTSACVRRWCSFLPERSSRSKGPCACISRGTWPLGHSQQAAFCTKGGWRCFTQARCAPLRSKRRRWSRPSLIGCGRFLRPQLADWYGGKYPDWKGQWNRQRRALVFPGQPSSVDPNKPWGLRTGGAAPTPEYQAILRGQSSRPRKRAELLRLAWRLLPVLRHAAHHLWVPADGNSSSRRKPPPCPDRLGRAHPPRLHRWP